MLDLYIDLLAENDLEEIIRYYYFEVPGLDKDFTKEVFATIDIARSFPNAYARYYKDYRKISLHRFPNNILYRKEKNTIVVALVISQHCDPKLIRVRLKGM